VHASSQACSCWWLLLLLLLLLPRPGLFLCAQPAVQVFRLLLLLLLLLLLWLRACDGTGPCLR
jgi:hypothetical protein